MWMTDDDLGDRVARFLHREDHVDLYSTDDLWQGIVHDANLRAFQFLQTLVLSKGFSEAQLEGWDRGLDFQRRLGTYYALKEGAILTDNFDYKNLEAMNCEKEADKAINTAILVGGVFEAPVTTSIADIDAASSGSLTAADQTLGHAIRTGPFRPRHYGYWGHDDCW